MSDANRFIRVALQPRWLMLAAAAACLAAGAGWARLGGVGGRGAQVPHASAAAPAPPVGAALAAVIADAGEFAPQAALIISARELACCLPDVFRDIVRAAHGKVRILCVACDQADRDAAREILRKAGLPDSAVQFICLPLDTMWVRDYGPFFARRLDGSVWVLDGDYSPADDCSEVRWRDNNVPRLLGEALGLPVEALPLRIAGGNLLSNGGGIVVTTAALLRDNADRGYSAAHIETLLKRHMGFSKWICLPELDDERTGHVDMYVTFPAENVAVVSQLDSSADPVNAEMLDRAAGQLAGVETRLGPMKVYRIPMEPGNDGVWRSYTNVIYANGVLMVPSFASADQAGREKALALYARLLPDWKIVPIPCDELARNEGLLHCVCRNVPAFVPIPPCGDNAGDDECLDLARVGGADGRSMPAGPGEILREDYPGADAALRPVPGERWILQSPGVTGSTRVPAASAAPTTLPAAISSAGEK
jgi:agmatine/peptidylarginine deiminase